MPKLRLPKYKYSAYVLVGSEWKFLFYRNTEYQAITDLKRMFKDYEENPEAYKVEKELRTKYDW